jgi:two-component system chemotaxis sensor kinase CheA
MDLRNLGRINVLIVEDDSFNVHLLSALLKKIADVEITSTDDGREAIEILESGEHAIDVILLDLHMPKMEGRDVLATIRQQSKYNHIPIIIISVDGLDEDELLKMGADDFVLKPFDIDKFAAVLEKQLS